MRLYHPYLVFLLLLLTCHPAAAASRWDGFAQWSLGNWERQENGRKVEEARHFTQQYSLLYHRDGFINGGKGGRYNVAFGGEWTSLDGEISTPLEDRDTGVDTFKILYRGEVLFAPGGLPFRLHAYSQDLRRSTFGRDFGLREDFDELDPGIATEILNGTHVRSGLTLMVGIKNGSYMGRYRDVLSQLPRLYVDYSQTDVKDVNSLVPQHYRERNLAFVSLNKKDNWFHFRYYDFEDFENPEDSFGEQVLMLGTVDHNLQRQWINLTNWIQVSVDGAFTKTNWQQPTRIPEERFNLNLFGVAARRNWKTSTFTTYERLDDGSDLEKRLEVPLFASGDISRDTGWRTRFIGFREEVHPFQNGEEVGEEGAFLSTRVETLRRNRYIVAPLVEIEVYESDDRGQGSAGRLGVEVFSNNLYRPRHALFGSYTYTVIDGEGEAPDRREVNYQEHKVTGKIDSQLNPYWRLGAQEDLLYASGDFDRNATRHIGANADLSFIRGTGDNLRVRGETWRSTSRLYAEWSPLSRWRNRAEFVLDHFDSEGGSLTQYNLRHSLDYDNRRWRARMTNDLIWGDGIQESSIPVLDVFDNAGAPLATGLEVDSQYIHSSSLVYSPGREAEFGFRNFIDWRSTNVGNQYVLESRQNFLYNLYTVNGFVRRLASVQEEIAYEAYRGTAGTKEDLGSFTLTGNYYPLKVVLLAAKIRYRRYFAEEQNEWTSFLNAGLVFQKLELRFEYAYGDREKGESEPSVKEHRWQITVTKTI